MGPATAGKTYLSIVIPSYNEEQRLGPGAQCPVFPGEAHALLLEARDDLAEAFTLLLVQAETLLNHLAEAGSHPPLEFRPVLPLPPALPPLLCLDRGHRNRDQRQYRH